MEDRMKEYIIADILWFEGFEKKHRHNLTELEKYNQHPWVQKYIKEEILGETT